MESFLLNDSSNFLKIRLPPRKTKETKHPKQFRKNPEQVEILLFSLGACQEITTKAFANAMGVPLTRVSVQLKGHIDLRGFFAVDDSVRAGFNKNLGALFWNSLEDGGQGAKRPGKKRLWFVCEFSVTETAILEFKAFEGKTLEFEFEDSKALCFWEPKVGVFLKVVDLNLFWKFGDGFFLEWSWSWMPPTNPNYHRNLLEESNTHEFAQDWRHLHCWVASWYWNHSTAESCSRCALPSEGYVTSCSYGDHSESCPKVKFEVNSDLLSLLGLVSQKRWRFWLIDQWSETNLCPFQVGWKGWLVKQVEFSPHRRSRDRNFECQSFWRIAT